jgi:GlpG protein
MQPLKFSYNAPFTLTFALTCVAAFVLGVFSSGWFIFQFFSIGSGFNWFNPIAYLRIFGHVRGPASTEHLVYNLSLFLLLGPILEEKYGARKLLLVTATVAVVTALPMLLIVPIFGNSRLLGASGVVFAMIVLSSHTRARKGAIPMTFALVCILFLGQEIYRAIYASDEVAQFAHILGGLVGIFFARRWD